MLIEMGNHDAVFADAGEKVVTTIAIPEFDADHKASCNPYGHKPGITVSEFKSHLADATAYRQPTRLPDHEALLAIIAAWPERGRGRPAWVKVTPHSVADLRDPADAQDIERFLTEFYECPALEGFYNDTDSETARVKKELEYWTKGGPPGECGAEILKLPDIQATYMVDGRIMNNLNDGGDTLQTVQNGIGSAATSITFTTGSTLVTNALAGHRLYVYSTTGGMVWGNIVSNTNAASASVITVDQWYAPLTPGGSAGATPSGGSWGWVCVDGGMISSWFAGIGTGTPTITNTDHSINTANTEYTQSGGTLIRKICPTATDVSSSARTVTLVPVFTANSSDVPNLPKVFSVVAFYASMVVSFAQAGGPMKFETAISPTATIAALGDNVTITETISGS